jgi:glycosyltransferase involved in cell wall biosynthesis
VTILHVIASMEAKTGGVAQAVRSLIQGHAERGISHEVVCLDTENPGEAMAESFPLHALGPHSTRWCYSPRLFPWLLRHLPRFDSVIIHGLWLYPSHAVRKALNRLRRTTQELPLCHVMPHGMLDPYFQRDASRRIKALRNWVMWKVIESKVVNQADALLFTCEEEMRLASQSFRPYRPQREAVVGLGLEAPPPATPAMHEAFQAACPDLGARPYWLFLSRIHPKKGVDLLTRAYREVWHEAGGATEALPDLVIAGPGWDTPFGREVWELAGQARVEGARVHTIDRLEGKAKWGAFYGCEVFLLPSHQENFGIAVAEAMACGKPVLIVSAGAGLVAEDTEQGTISLLRQWLDLPLSESAAMGAKALTCFQDLFEIGRAVRTFKRLILS